MSSTVAFLDMTDSGSSLYLFERKKGGGYELTGEFGFPPAGSDAETSRLRGADAIYLSIPISSLDFRLVELPFSDKARIGEVLPLQIEGLIMDKEVVVDACALKQGDTSAERRKMPFLAVYTGKERLRKILDGLASSGIEPEIITSIDLRAAVAGGGNAEDTVRSLFSGSEVEKSKRPRYALSEINAASINLRKGEFAYTKKLDETKKSLRLTAVLYLLLAAVVISHLAVNTISARSRADSLKADIRKSYLEMFPADRKVTNELYQTKAKIKELRERKGLVAGISPLETLLKVSGVSGQGILFTEMNMDGADVVLKGEAPSLGNIQKIKAGLEGLLSDISISETKNVSQVKVLFTITAKEKE